jgi:hypothetical protein
LAKTFDLKKPQLVIEQARAAVQRFPNFAEEAGVSRAEIARVAAVLDVALPRKPTPRTASKKAGKKRRER